MRTEHQVVVVFDVTAEDRRQAAAVVLGVLNGDRGWRVLDDGTAADAALESWWFPEADLKPLDRNDNPVGRLVLDSAVAVAPEPTS